MAWRVAEPCDAGTRKRIPPRRILSRALDSGARLLLRRAAGFLGLLGGGIERRDVLDRVLHEGVGALRAAEPDQAGAVEVVDALAFDLLVADRAGREGIGLLLRLDQSLVDLRHVLGGVLLEGRDAVLAAEAHEPRAVDVIERGAGRSELLAAHRALGQRIGGLLLLHHGVVDLLQDRRGVLLELLDAVLAAEAHESPFVDEVHRLARLAQLLLAHQAMVERIRGELLGDDLGVLGSRFLGGLLERDRGSGKAERREGEGNESHDCSWAEALRGNTRGDGDTPHRGAACPLPRAVDLNRTTFTAMLSGGPNEVVPGRTRVQGPSIPPRACDRAPAAASRRRRASSRRACR